MREPGGGMGLEVALRWPGPRSHLHGGRDLLSPACIGHPDYCDLRHIGVAQQGILDFGRVDVFAAPDDDIARTPQHADISSRIECAKVAGMQKAVAIDSCRAGIWRAVIALHHHRSTNPDFASLAQLPHRSADWIYNLEFDMGGASADRLGQQVRRIARCAAGDYRAFGLRIGDQNRSAEFPHQTLDQRLRHLSAASPHSAQ